MAHQVINPSHFPKPRGYANGVVSQGRLLYIAGQIAWDKDARIVSPDFATQFLQALDNVIAVVREAGGATEHIVKLLAFVTDLDGYRAATAAIGEGLARPNGQVLPGDEPREGRRSARAGSPRRNRRRRDAPGLSARAR